MGVVNSANVLEVEVVRESIDDKTSDVLDRPKPQLDFVGRRRHITVTVAILKRANFSRKQDRQDASRTKWGVMFLSIDAISSPSSTSRPSGWNSGRIARQASLSNGSQKGARGSER